MGRNLGAIGNALGNPFRYYWEENDSPNVKPVLMR